MLLSTVAGTLRRLVVEKERARKAAGDRRIGSVREWESIVFPTIPEEEIGKKKPYGFWMKYQASARFGLAELLDAIAGLAEADVAMKSGQDARMALERVLVALLAPESRGRKTP
jgi:DNA polymerase-3 subunit delta